jgi:DNA-binding MarR family transcriptional regulator
MTLNVSDTLSVAQASDRRRRLSEDLVNELTSWNPREFLAMFRKFQRGALSLVHLNVLMLLETDGPRSMGALAHRLDVSVASATGIVSRMEARGFVERRHSAGDRRVVQVHRTDVGANVFVEIDQRRREGLTRLLEHLTDEELAGFLAGHRALRAARTAMTAQAMTAQQDATPAGTTDDANPPRGATE